MVTAPGCGGGGIFSFPAGAPTIQQLRLCLVAEEPGAEVQVSGSDGHTPVTEEGSCLQSPSQVWHLLLAMPGCKPLHICFFNLKPGPHRRKWHQTIVFWQQLLQHNVFSLVLVCSPFPISVQLQDKKGRHSCGFCCTNKR